MHHLFLLLTYSFFLYIICFSIEKYLFRTVNAATYQSIIGLETQRGFVKSLCQAGLCDTIVIIDCPTGDYISSIKEIYSTFKQWILSVNPTINIVRINPANLRIGEDMIESFVDLLKKDEKISSRFATFAARHDPLLLLNSDTKRLKIPNVRLSFRSEIGTFQSGLCCYKIPLPLPALSLPSLLTILKLLFPLAFVSCPAIYLADTWHPNINNKCFKRGFKRLIDLAKIKIFVAKRSFEERKILQDYLSQFNNNNNNNNNNSNNNNNNNNNKSEKPTSKFNSKVTHDIMNVKLSSEISMLKVGLKAVSGVISLGYNTQFKAGTTCSRSPMLVTIEACAGAIIVMEYKIPLYANTATGITASQELMAQGSFTKSTKTLLLELFLTSSFIHLRAKPILTHCDITSKMTERAQVKLCGDNHQIRPIPEGWWFDGNVYVDVDGNQRKFRPDIDEILDMHLEEKNEEIRKYNALLDDIKFYL